MWEMELHKKIFHPQDAQTELSEKSPASPINLKAQSTQGEVKLPGCKQFEGKCFCGIKQDIKFYLLLMFLLLFQLFSSSKFSFSIYSKLFQKLHLAWCLIIVMSLLTDETSRRGQFLRRQKNIRFILFSIHSSSVYFKKSRIIASDISF